MNLGTLIDAGLELSIFGSFSRVGYVVRRRLFGWGAPPDGSLEGRTVLITGPTSGLGRATTDALAALGARVVLVGRSHERLAAVRDALVAAHGEDRFPIVVADMSSLASVRAAVTRVLQSEDRLDVLVDNAGAIFPERVEGPDGLEGTLATLVVGPFVLVSGLLPLLQRTPGSRVIAVTSGGMYTQRLDLDDLQGTAEPYSGPRAYARGKRAQVALIREWARRLAWPEGGSGIRFNAMHPGWADTPGVESSLPTFHKIVGKALRTPAEGADTITWLAAADEPAQSSGGFWQDRAERPVNRRPGTASKAGDDRLLADYLLELAASA